MQAVSGLLYWWVPVEGAWVPISAVGVAIGLSSAASQTMLYSHLSASWVGETDAAFACSNGLTGFAQRIGFFAAGTQRNSSLSTRCPRCRIIWPIYPLNNVSAFFLVATLTHMPMCAYVGVCRDATDAHDADGCGASTARWRHRFLLIRRLGERMKLRRSTVRSILSVIRYITGDVMTKRYAAATVQSHCPPHCSALASCSNAGRP